jgi:hypothetical protein
MPSANICSWSGWDEPPEIRYQRPEDIEPRLRRILDALTPAPALTKTATWDVVAWNQVTTVLWPNLGQLAANERNTFLLVFLDPRARELFHAIRGNIC